MSLQERLEAIEARLDSFEEKIESFQESVKTLIVHATMNAEAIVEHIAQLDSEKDEILQEYRDELSRIVQECTKK